MERACNELRMKCLQAGVALAVVGSLAGTAHASPGNVVAVIKAQDALVRRMPQFKEYDSHLDVKTPGEAKKLIPAIGPLEKASARAVRVVAKASTSSAKQRRGKALWVTSAELEDRAALVYRTALEDLVAGRLSAFRAVDTKAQKLIAEGVTQSAIADRLLGISIND